MSVTDRPAEIEADIRLTRGNIDATIDALRERLSPSQLMDKAVGYVRDGGSEFGQNLVNRVKANPLPVVLMGAAVAWMMFSDGRPRPAAQPAPRRAGSIAERAAAFDGGTARPSPSYGRGDVEGADRRWQYAGIDERDYDETFPELTAEEIEAVGHHDRVHRATSSVKQQVSETAEAFGERLHAARATAMGIAQNAGESITAFKDRVEVAFSDLRDKAESTRARVMERMSSAAEGARHRAADAAHAVRDTTRQLTDRAERVVQEQPLVLGAIGLALGALAGALIPKTRQENELVGSIGDQVREQARGYAQQARHVAEETVERAAEAAKDVVRDEGLDLDHPADAVANAAKKAGEVGRRAVRATTDEVEWQIHRGGVH